MSLFIVYLLAWILCGGISEGMLSKRPLSSMSELAEERRFAADVVEMAMGGDISFKKARRICENSLIQDPALTKKFIKAGNNGKNEKNIARDFLRAAKRKSQWPKVYIAEIPFYNRKTKEREMMKIELLLPHEILHELLSANEVQKFIAEQQKNWSNQTKKHIEMVSEKIGCSCEELMALGIWMDGVPYTHDRKNSLEAVLLSFPGLPHLRIPITAFPKHFKFKQETYDAIFNIISWSFQHLLIDTFPSSRHDLSDWNETDKYRKNKSNSSIGIRCVLSEVRGDWAAFKDTFRLPGWKDAGPICWLCGCQQDTRTQFDTRASWRSQRLTHYQFLVRQRQLNRSLTTLLKCP